MSDFVYANIYVIYCEELLKKDYMMFSVGSTVLPLNSRLSLHIDKSKDLNRNSSLYIKMREYGAENWEMDLVEVVKVPNTTRQIRDRAKCKHEQRWIDKLTKQEGIRPKLNDMDAFMDVEKFKEHRRQYAKERYKNRTPEQKQKFSENHKKYYEDHKEDVKSRVNEYQLENRDEINRKKLESYHKNSTAINQKLADKRAKNKVSGTFRCEECGTSYGSEFLRKRHFEEQHGQNVDEIKAIKTAKYKKTMSKIIEYNGVEMTKQEKVYLQRREKRARKRQDNLTL